MRLSASAINTWGQCALQAKYHYVDKLPQKQSGASSYGTAVHDALELFLECRDVDVAVKRFRYVWDNPEVLGIEPDFYFPRTSFASYRERGPKMIEAYAESFFAADVDLICTEHPFYVPFGEHDLSGRVDAIYIKNDTLVIEDHKTGQVPTYGDLALNVQLTIYYYASLQKEFWTDLERGEEIYERFLGQHRDIVWYDLRNNKPMYAGKRGNRDFRRLYAACEQIAKAMELEVFVPTITGKSCGICSYTDVCEAHPAPETILQIEKKEKQIDC